jgi:hypothetical protein
MNRGTLKCDWEKRAIYFPSGCVVLLSAPRSSLDHSPYCILNLKTGDTCIGILEA